MCEHAQFCRARLHSLRKKSVAQPLLAVRRLLSSRKQSTGKSACATKTRLKWTFSANCFSRAVRRWEINAASAAGVWILGCQTGSGSRTPRRAKLKMKVGILAVQGDFEAH